MKASKLLLTISMVATTLLLTTSCAKRIHDSATPHHPTPNTQHPTPNTQHPTPNTTQHPTPATAQTLQMANAQRSGLQQVTGKMSLALNANGHSVSLSGNIKMKRNDVIQLSAQMFGMEVARIELTNDYVMLVNRYQKQYMKLGYNDIPYFRSNGISFYAFQSLFWNELFELGAEDRQPSHQAFLESQTGEETILATRSQQVALEFLVNSLNGVLKQTTIKPDNVGTGLQWKYNGWTIVDGKSFPCDMRLTTGVQGYSIEADFKLSRLRSDNSWTDTRTTIDTKRYEEITAQKAMLMIQSLLK